MLEIEDEYESDEDEYDKVPVNKPKHLQETHETNEIRRIPREINRRNWIYRALRRAYNRYRPVVWRFFDDRRSSLTALV